MSPFRLSEFRSKIQFTSSASMPRRIYEACVAKGIVSNTVYCQLAICEALSRDLGIPIEELLAELPEPRGPAKHVYERGAGVDQVTHGGVVMVGPANTVEDVL